jgi:hypothetical protein
LAAGGGFATRVLYTNAEESVIDVKRPCIINGISAVGTRPDLIDRIIHLDLPELGSYIAKKDRGANTLSLPVIGWSALSASSACSKLNFSVIV